MNISSKNGQCSLFNSQLSFYSGNLLLQKPLRRQLAPEPEVAGAFQHSGTQSSELHSGAGIVIEDGNLIGSRAAGNLAGEQILDLVDGIPILDSLLRGSPNIRRLIQFRHFLRVNDINIGAPDRFVIDLPALTGSVGASNRGNIHSLLDPMSVKDRVPC